MIFHSDTNENLSDIASVIRQATDAMLRRDLESMVKILGNVWPSVGLDPEFLDYPKLEQAHLLHLVAYYLSKTGDDRNLKDYQPRARKLAIQARDLFEELGHTDLAAEANITHAFCYQFEGAVLECEAILEKTAENYRGDHLHQVYLRIQSSLLQTANWKGDYQSALQIIQEIDVPIEFCKSPHVQSIFFTSAGFTYKRIGKFDKAVYYYDKAIETAQEVGNFVFVSVGKNNLAGLYNLLANYNLAHSFADEAIDLAKKLKITGWLADFLDTKSFIYFNESRYYLALATIDEALSIFRQGGDAFGLTEALWNKVRYLLELDKKEEALLVFAELSEIARKKIGEFGVKKFAKEFAELFHAKRGLPLDDEIRRFKKMEVEAAMRKSDNNLTEAAEILKISESKLNRILLNEFPELRQELEAKMRLETGDVISAKELAKAEAAKQAAHRDVRPLQLHDVAIFFENTPGFGLDADAHTYYVSADRMRRVFGYDDDAVIAVVPGVTPSPGDFILAESLSGTDHYLSRVSYEKEIGSGYLLDEEEQLSLEETRITGKAIAYCPFENVADETLVFRPLPSQNPV